MTGNKCEAGSSFLSHTDFVWKHSGQAALGCAQGDGNLYWV